MKGRDSSGPYEMWKEVRRLPCAYFLFAKFIPMRRSRPFNLKILF